MPEFSLLDGPWTVGVQLGVAALLAVALGVRTPRWRRFWWPALLIVAALAALGARGLLVSGGAVPGDAPPSLWGWLGVAVAGLVAVVAGWSSARWWRRALSLVVVPLCLVCAGVVANQWTGTFATSTQAWEDAIGAPLPQQVPFADLAAARRDGALPDAGRVVGVDLAGPSGFRRREEYAYLPPLWFRSRDAAAHLPVLVMVGAELSTASAWVRPGAAVATADAYAREHGGAGPILLFVDAAGGPTTDTECVNGPRGRAADHLTLDTRAFASTRLGAGTDRRLWGVVGWSMGGTCAVDVAVMHPELFATFLDVSGDVGPNSGSRAQTVDRLFGGDRDAWARFDPLTVLARHGRYDDLAGRFVTARDDRGAAGEQTVARRLCDAASARAVVCDVRVTPGRHVWQHAATAFAEGLPWLMQRSGYPPELAPSSR